MKIDLEKLAKFLSPRGKGRVCSYPTYWNYYEAEIYTESQRDSKGNKIIEHEGSLIDCPEVEGIVPWSRINLDRRMCFGSFLSKINGFLKLDEDEDDPNVNRSMMRPVIHIGIYRERDLRDSSTHNTFVNNVTWMSREQLEEHINYLVSPDGLNIPVDIKISEHELSWYDYFDKIPIYNIDIDFGRKTTIRQIKFVLFWIRYAYEAPSNIAMIDAYKLKELYYPDEEIYNLLTVTSRLINVFYNINTSQSIHFFGHFVEKARFLKELKSTKGDLSSIYLKGGNNNLPRAEVLPIIDDLDDEFYKFKKENKEALGESDSYMTLQSWLKFEYRFTLYRKLYKIHKENELRSEIY